jgi:hypothetical protein
LRNPVALILLIPVALITPRRSCGKRRVINRAGPPETRPQLPTQFQPLRARTGRCIYDAPTPDFIARPRQFFPPTSGPLLASQQWHRRRPVIGVGRLTNPTDPSAPWPLCVFALKPGDVAPPLPLRFAFSRPPSFCRKLLPRGSLLPHRVHPPIRPHTIFRFGRLDSAGREVALSE